MATIQHDAILVVEDEDRAEAIWSEVREVLARGSQRYENLLSPIVPARANGYCSFMIAPDGSKEGWHPSDEMDDLRGDICGLLDRRRVRYVYVSFGELGDRLRV